MTEGERILRNFIDWFAPSEKVNDDLNNALISLKFGLANCINCKHWSKNIEQPCNNPKFDKEILKNRTVYSSPCIHWISEKDN